jgi:hypothetical protein
MWRLLAGICAGVCTIVALNTVLLLFTPLRGIPLEGINFFWDKVFGVLALAVWAAAALGASVLACRVAGKLEGLVSIAVVVLGTAFLVGLTLAFLDRITAAYLQLGSTVLSLPLLFIFYAGGLISFFARRPEIV